MLAVTVGCGEPLEVLSLAHSPSQSADPAWRFGVPSYDLVGLVAEGLTRYRPSGEIEPALATGWTVDSGGTRYVFRMRAGARFHDGRPVTAGDARRSLTDMMRGTDGVALDAYRVIHGTEDFRAGRSAGITGIRTLDDSTLAISLTRPFVALPALLAHPRAAIRSPEAVESPGSGPWVLLSVTDTLVRLERNADHWEAPPLQDSLIVRLWTDRTRGLAAFESGEVAATIVPLEETARMVRTRAREIVRGPTHHLTYIALNTRRAILGDPRIRHAVNHATDVGSMLRTLIQERGHVAPGPIPPAWEGHDFNQAPFPLAPEHAQRLLVDADWPGGGFTLILAYDATNPLHAQIAEAVQWDLGRLGIEIVPTPLSGAELGATARQRQFDLLITEWTAPYFASSAMLRPLFHSSSSPDQGNIAGLEDARLDSLIERAERETNPTLRYELYRAANHRVLEMAPAIFLWFPEDVWLVRREVADWEMPRIAGSQRWSRTYLR